MSLQRIKVRFAKFKKVDILLMALLLIMKSAFIRPYFHFMPIRYGVSFHFGIATKGKSDLGFEFFDH